jgi:hypothetical protein
MKSTEKMRLYSNRPRDLTLDDDDDDDDDELFLRNYDSKTYKLREE